MPTPAESSTPVAGPAGPASLQGKGLVVFANATACYLLAYQLCTVLYQYAMVQMARREHVPGRWTTGGVRFTITDGEWNYNAVLNVYITGPLLMLLASVLAYILFWKWLRFHRGLAKLLMLWLCFHATNYLLGGLLADSITQSGSAYVPSWLLGTGMGTALVAGLLAGVVQVALGYALGIPFLLAQESRTLLQFDNRPLLIRYTVVGPWLAGSALLVLSRLPLLTTNEVLHYATMGLLLVPLAIGLGLQTLGETPVKPRATHISWGVVALAALAVVAWRVALGGVGISF